MFSCSIRVENINLRFKYKTYPRTEIKDKNIDNA